MLVGSSRLVLAASGREGGVWLLGLPGGFRRLVTRPQPLVSHTITGEWSDEAETNTLVSLVLKVCGCTVNL